MTPEQLRVFVTVAEMQHVTRAAQVLNMTQSTASAAIAALESRHDVRLFDRIGRGIALTEEGRAFLPEARAVLARLTEAEAMLSDTRSLARGHIRMIASQTIAGYWLPARIASFRRLHPGLTITLTIGNTRDAMEEVLRGRLDLALVEGRVSDPLLERREIGRDSLRLVSAPPGPRCPSAQVIRDADWVLREAGSGTRSSAEDALADLGFEPPALGNALVLPSNEAVMSAVEAGAGIAILSALVVARSLDAGSLVDCGLTLAPRPFYALRHKGHYLTRATDAFLRSLQDS
ncbi:LysR substrate-binding domain-containing protein [Paracoccus sp. 1_MG-2023]|uniref:LysR substrate-binding domain-containing protein n=1 Tax=unclassified Paracoccus (in: a-proteobacteria) TaxID=2688777 RepID=UPI001C09635A|nr:MULTISPECIES: LysR substrate-binding domain-containing protein [unclassified Paracoccus (in: a-proteobacteria)]MBU2957986.1 LysR family transcriptional regulator [Paracoccus sp. C2R09]MDO6668820.1 LysR substrate-binding domain-containing protein [Paracoccus sp. 1_MG-2023]